MSYNGLTVPLDIGSWSCELVPVDDYRTPSGEWLRFARGDELRRIEGDRRTRHGAMSGCWSYVSRPTYLRGLYRACIRQISDLQGILN